jgi:isoamylase
MFLAGERTGRRTVAGEPIHDESFLLWLHAGGEAVKVSLPGPPWALAYSVIVDSSDSVVPRHLAGYEELQLPPHCAVLLRAE